MFEAIFNVEGNEVRVPASISVFDGDEFYVYLEEGLTFNGEEIPANAELSDYPALVAAWVNEAEADAIAEELLAEAEDEARDWILAQQELEDFEGCGWE